MSNEKKLVLYFSASSVTARVAGRLASLAGADLMEIEPEEKYTAHDLDWTDRKSRSSLEMKDPSSRPRIRKPDADFSQYSDVYIGFPIWWGVAPHAVKSFLDSMDLSGKRITVFATSGGSPVSHALDDLKRSYPDLDFAKAVLVRGDNVKEVLA